MAVRPGGRVPSPVTRVPLPCRTPCKPSTSTMLDIGGSSIWMICSPWVPTSHVVCTPGAALIIVVASLLISVPLVCSQKKSVPAASWGITDERERGPRANPCSTHESSQRSSPKGFSPNSASQRQATCALRCRSLRLCADAHGTKSCPQRGHSTCAPLTCVASPLVPRAWS